MRTQRGVIGLVIAALGLGVLGTGSVAAPAVAATPAAQGLSIGTWNAELRPWFSNQQAVVDTVAATNFDVLGLQGVWSDAAKDAIVSDPRIAQKYPYTYYPAPEQATASCPSTVPIPFQTDWINSFIAQSVDTRTAIHPTLPLPTSSELFGLNIELISPPCYEALLSTMQTLDNGVDAYQAIERAAAGTAVRYVHGGRSGQLILSSRPLQDTSTTYSETYLTHRAAVRATVDGVRLSFADWPHNYLEEFNPVLAPLQTGPLQPDFALQEQLDRPDVVIGTLNSAPDFQPSGYIVLLANDAYSPLFNQPTYCPASTHAGYPLCQSPVYGSDVPLELSVDNIMVNSLMRCQASTTFATTPASDHIGLASVCVKNTAPTVQDDSYNADQNTSLAVPAPGVLGNDTDAQGDPVTATLATGPAHAASFTLNADGSFSYTPVAGYLGTDTFTYTAGDGTLTSGTATATITVRPLFPRTGVLDTFNRADGAVGASWSGTSGSAFYKIVGNRLDVQAGGPLVWKPTSFGATQEALVTLSTIDPKGPMQGVLLKVQGGTAPDNGAIIAGYDAKAKVVRVSALRVGARTWTVYPTKAVTFAAGDVLGARARADGTVEVYRNGTRLTTISLNAADKAFFAAKGGRIGVWTLASAAAVLDDFGGGTVN